MRNRRIFGLGGIAVVVVAGALALTTRGRAAPGKIPLQAPAGTAFTYQGYLEDGGAPADGLYDFEFELYDDPVTGSQIGSTLALENVDVADGVFTVTLDFGDQFDGTPLWLEIHLRPGASTGGYQQLLPRQSLTSVPFASYARSIPLAGSGTADTASRSDHNHWGESWGGIGTGLSLTTSGTDTALEAQSLGTAINGVSVMTTGLVYGVLGETDSNTGRAVAGIANSATGYTYGIYGLTFSSNGTGVFGHGNIGVRGYGSTEGGTGVRGEAGPGNDLNYGVYGTTDSSGGYGGFFMNSDGGALLAADDDYDPADLRFRVSNVGNVFADGSFTGGGADFADLLPVESGAGPGDVLCMGADGIAVRSSEALDPTTIGVYSTEPGFIAGGNEEDQSAVGKTPVAMMGVVPVKASAENGPVQIGDLLVSASLPGYAMRCEGVETCFGRVIGKALEPLDAGTGLIQILVMAR
jgi:hypothetical protein